MKYIVDGDIVVATAQQVRWRHRLRGSRNGHGIKDTRGIRLPAGAARRVFESMAWAAGHQTRRVSAEHPRRYLQSRARRVKMHRGDAASLRQFMEFLRRHA